MFNIIFCQWLDSNRGPLELEATALPTEPQPLPPIDDFTIKILVVVYLWKRGLGGSVPIQKRLGLTIDLVC